MSSILATVTLLGAFSLANAADDPNGLPRCRAIADSLQRLTCYDRAIDAAASPPTRYISGAEYRPVSIPEVLAEFDQIEGQKLAISGVLQQLGQVVMLKTGLYEITFIFIEIKSAPREQRREVYERCGKGCKVNVRGVATKVMMQPGISAESLELL